MGLRNQGVTIEHDLSLERSKTSQTSRREPTLSTVAVHGTDLLIELDKVISTVDGKGPSSTRQATCCKRRERKFLLRQIVTFHTGA
jgi:hypothetical protein